MSSMFSFQNVWPIKRKAVYTNVLLRTFIHFLVACENLIRSQLVCFLKYLIFNFSKLSGHCRRQEVSVASGGKFYWLPPDEENTVAKKVLGVSFQTVDYEPLTAEYCVSYMIMEYEDSRNTNKLIPSMSFKSKNLKAMVTLHNSAVRPVTCLHQIRSNWCSQP